MLSKKALDEFRKIYQQEYGITLSDKELVEKARRFIYLMKAIYKPLVKEAL